MGRSLLAGLARRATATAFGEDVTLTHGPASWTVRGVFDDSTTSAEHGLAAQLSTAPRLRLALADIDDVTPVEDDDTVSARGQTYTIRTVVHDGAGGVLLTLRLGGT